MSYNINRLQTAPVRTPRTMRRQPIAVMTTFKAGVCAPVAVIPMLREEQMRASVQLTCEMMETSELLANKVMMRATAYLVPTLAFPRFEGSRDQLDRSYMGQPQIEGGDVVPYIVNKAAGTHGGNEIMKTLGLHAKPGDQINDMYDEAYTLIWNMRAKNRSLDITPRGFNETNLAPAFWNDSRFAHVLPSFDQAVLDGEVVLDIVAQSLQVRGIARRSGGTIAPEADVTITGGEVYPFGVNLNHADANDIVIKTTSNGSPNMFVEMVDDGVTVSLANIAVAKKAQWFARLRQRFEGYDDEYIIDMLMNGLSIPEQHLKQPILLADVTTQFGQVKRYATDGDNMTESAVSGGAVLAFDINVPKLATGGVVMVIVETMPQQLYERQQDPFLHLKTADHLDQLPDYMRDEMDPQKVDIIYNKQVDTSHATPDGVFGYWPMNSKWNSFGPRIGGDFYRPTTDAGTAGVRARFWAQEDVNPTLSESFYLVKDLQTKPFLDETIDQFQLAVTGQAALVGNTVFGGMLVAETNNYDAVMDKVPAEQIDQEA